MFLIISKVELKALQIIGDYMSREITIVNIFDHLTRKEQSKVMGLLCNSSELIGVEYTEDIIEGKSNLYDRVRVYYRKWGRVYSTITSVHHNGKG